tara:strand:+ start:1260 stop:1511 length:252 start_codon:yes stop_codon:yes gene_type:complete
MEANNEDKRNGALQRLSFRGLEQLPGFTGNEGDYTSIGSIIFRGQSSGNTIRWMDDGSLWSRSETSSNYNPRSADEFIGLTYS